MPVFGTADALPACEGVQPVVFEDVSAAAFAAEGAARVSDEPCVLYLRGELQALKGASAVPQAWGDGIPLIIVTHVPSHSVERIASVYASVVGHSVVGTGKEGAAETLGRLVHNGGPSHAIVVDDVPAEDVIATAAQIRPTAAAPLASASRPSQAELEEALAVLDRRPVLLLGSEGLRTCPLDRVAELAGRLQAPVLLTASATALVGRLDVDLDPLRGQGIPVVPNPNPVWHLCMRGAGGILALGSRLAEADLFGLRDIRLYRAKVVVVSTADVGLEERSDHWFECDCESFVQALSPLLEGRSNAWRGIWPARAGRRYRRFGELAARYAKREEDEPEIDPAWAAWRIARAAPKGTRFLAEGSISGLWIRTYADMRDVITPVQMGSIGVAVPWAAGVGTVCPDTPVWSVIGDGGFLFQPAALRELRRLACPPALFVFNDASWNSIRLAQTVVFSSRYVGTDLPRMDYAEIARWFDCEGLVARDPSQLNEALERATATDRVKPLIVDVRIRPGTIPWLGLGFALAELDYIVRPMLLRILPSLLRAALAGQLRWRSITLPLELRLQR